MIDLRDAYIKEWLSLLPEDVKSSLPDDLESEPDGMQAFCMELESSSQMDYPKVILKNSEIIEKMGRTRRIRLLSWVSGKVYPYNVKVFKAITESDEDDGESASSIKILFLEDIKAINDAIADRLSAKVLNKQAFEVIRSAAFEVNPEPGFKQ